MPVFVRFPPDVCETRTGIEMYQKTTVQMWPLGHTFTLAPFCRRTSVMALPMPIAAPVTTADLPLRDIFSEPKKNGTPPAGPEDGARSQRPRPPGPAVSEHVARRCHVTVGEL